MEIETEDATDLDSNLTLPHLPWLLSSEHGFGSLRRSYGESRNEYECLEQLLRDDIRRMELRALRSRHGWRRGSRNISTGLLFRTNHEASLKSSGVNSAQLIARALAGDSTEEKREGSSPRCFDCNICLQVARDPILTSCGHLFCWPCLYRWINDESDGANGCCFVCKEEVEETSLTPIYGRGISDGDSDKRGSEEIVSTVPPRPRGCRIESLRQGMLSGSSRSSSGSMYSWRIEEMMRRIGIRADLGVGEPSARYRNSGRRSSNSGRVRRSDGVDGFDAGFGESVVRESVEEAIRRVGIRLGVRAGEPDLGHLDSFQRILWCPIAPWVRRSDPLHDSDVGLGEMIAPESVSNEEMIGIRADVAADGPNPQPWDMVQRSRRLDAGEFVWDEAWGPADALQGLVDNRDSVSSGVGGVFRSPDVAAEGPNPQPWDFVQRSHSRWARPQSRRLDAGEFVWDEAWGPGDALQGLVDNRDSVSSGVGGVVRSADVAAEGPNPQLWDLVQRSDSRWARTQSRRLDAGEFLWDEAWGPGDALQGLVDNRDSVSSVGGGGVRSERDILDSNSVGSDSIGSSSPPFRRRRRNEPSSSSIANGGVSNALRRRRLA